MVSHELRRLRGGFALCVGVAVIAVWSVLLAGQVRPPSLNRAPLRQISSVDGKDLYNEYCAQCHGAEGKGDGRAASTLKTPPADLTKLAAHDRGKYNKRAVEAFIKGDRPGGWLASDSRGNPIIMTANGPDEMPAWGIIFRYMWPDEPIVIRCGNPAGYIEKLQVK